MRLTTEIRVGLFVLSALAIFFTIGFYIGSFRISHGRYHTYIAHFKDSAGVQRKSEVKIAGVKVGWIEDVQLIGNQEHLHAQITLCVEKHYTLYQDAHALVKQDGILGAKFIEIIPGDPQKLPLKNGSQLIEHDDQIICMDELIEQAQTIAHTIRESTEALKGALGEGELIQSIQNITQKIDQGNGALGKLVNDTTLYNHISQTSEAVHSWIHHINNFRLTADSYIEAMQKSAEHSLFKDTKAFFNVRLHPRVEYFFQFQVIASEKGFIRRKEIDSIFCAEKSEYRLQEKRETTNRHRLKFGFQFGQIIRDVFALRLGIIESSAGIAFDLKLPFPSKNFQWITTIELFDFHGFNRKHDQRVHIKWLNRLVIFKNIYFAFGVDDFASRDNGSAFFGAGIFFNSDTINHFFPDYK